MDAMGAVGVADRVMNVLQGRGPRTFEDLFLDLPDLNWLQLSVVLEKLIRDGDIAIWRTDEGDYRISAQSSQLMH